MKTIYDIQQFLKKMGTIIYIGDRAADLELMEMEIRQIYESNLMDVKDYQMAILLLRQERQRVLEKK
ncbi:MULTISPECIES: YqgQ family protein [Metabacillus]|jgi:uncharacterized protein YqgQ|uniref:Cytosolic protein n=1 Tax=Metabacillus indicus TaxID=246786 RepID=A0A084GWJ2_METID|nr:MULTISPECIES: YqgQ family protein [Metabacillus]KEZ51015.1 hypothetical protein AZ46_0210390 [Metabacillus indicus LMG 22858]KEZ51704.1 hypothetical protein GS18_0211305 [Metabacillus indicus]MDX8291150.1 YqgQ family protein [Metabacillus indicus]